MDISGVVSIVKSNGKEIKSIGTGFFIEGNNYLLTCYHVLKDAGCCNIGNIIGFMYEGQTQVLSARNCQKIIFNFLA